MRGRSGRGPQDGRRRRITGGIRTGANLAKHVLAVPSRMLRGRPSDTELDVRLSVSEVAPVSPALPPIAGVAPTNEGELPNPPLLTGDQGASRRFKFLIVNACTIASLGLGMTAIVLAMHQHVQIAALLLLFCIAFDGLDGALARKFGVSTPFGAQMDSLADMCSFGIATPVVAYAWLLGTTPEWIVTPICALVGICAAIRLARFNISPKSSSYFVGVPTTMAAAIIVIATLLMPEPARIIPAAAIAVIALLMVSSFPYVKWSQLRRVPIVLWLIPIALAVVNPPLAFATIIGLYLASGLFLYARGTR